MIENKTPDLPDRKSDYYAWSLAIWERAVDRARREQYGRAGIDAPEGRAA